MKNAICIGLLIVFFSCTRNIEPETPDKLFEKYQDGVVLIANQYYYEVYLDDEIFYYSPQSEKKLFLNLENALENLSFITGTGFVVAENGKIMTNRHVVSPKVINYKDELVNINESFKNNINYKIVAYNDSIKMISDYYTDNELQISQYQKEELFEEYKSFKDLKETFASFYKVFSSWDFNNAEIKLVIHKLAVAYNNTHVEDLEDLQECVLLKEASDEKIDLALIQTKTQIFNKKPEHIFNFKDNNPNIAANPKEYKERNIKNPAKINDDVYMIGFNQGFNLASTAQGIKSQFTSGTISQESDGERILYTIPTLEGSSGSPIIDKWGNLVAVNFAKVSNTQSFSFGVPLKEVIKFYEE